MSIYKNVCLPTNKESSRDRKMEEIHFMNGLI